MCRNAGIPATAELSLNEIAAQGGAVPEVYRWLSLTDTWDGHVKDLGFNDFPLALGQGYFFKAMSEGT